MRYDIPCPDVGHLCSAPYAQGQRPGNSGRVMHWQHEPLADFYKH